jgi:hypothetical protein
MVLTLRLDENQEELVEYLKNLTGEKTSSKAIFSGIAYMRSLINLQITEINSLRAEIREVVRESQKTEEAYEILESLRRYLDQTDL